MKIIVILIFFGISLLVRGDVPRPSTPIEGGEGAWMGPNDEDIEEISDSSDEEYDDEAGSPFERCLLRIGALIDRDNVYRNGETPRDAVVTLTNTYCGYLIYQA